MSIEDAQTIDAIGTDKIGNVILTISDHLLWNSKHLSLLQDKLNNYLSFIESGEIYETYPTAKNSAIKINIVCKHEPTSEGAIFLSKCADIIANAGFEFGYETVI